MCVTAPNLELEGNREITFNENEGFGIRGNGGHVAVLAGIKGGGEGDSSSVLRTIKQFGRAVAGDRLEGKVVPSEWRWMGGEGERGRGEGWEGSGRKRRMVGIREETEKGRG